MNVGIAFIVSIIPSENDSAIPAQDDGVKMSMTVTIQLSEASGATNVSVRFLHKTLLLVPTHGIVLMDSISITVMEASISLGALRSKKPTTASSTPPTLSKNMRHSVGR